MPLQRDLSNLPAADKATEGEPPDPNPRFIQVLVESMAAAKLDAEPDGKPTAFGTRMRHSDAGKCARALGYTAIGLPPSDPMDLAGTWVTSLGSTIHEMWQEALCNTVIGENAVCEVKLRIDGFDASGHSDARIDTESISESIFDADGKRLGPAPHRICYELKTTGGFGYKMKVGERGAPEGPDYSHKWQGALNAVADDADELIIGYLATEAISKPAAARSRNPINELTRFAAEWSYPREVFEPWAAQEKRRMQRILDIVDAGNLPARVIPSPELPRNHEIVDPSKGRWETRVSGEIVDTGSYWGCGYCSFQSVCSTTSSGRIPIASVKP